MDNEKNTGESRPDNITVLSEIIDGLRKELKDAQDYNEKMRKSLELQEAKENLKKLQATGQTGPSVIVGRSFNPITAQEKLAAPYVKDDPGSKYRFISTHSSVWPVRRAQGYVPVKDPDGNEVRDVDTVLAKMPKARYEAEILNPRRELQQAMKQNIATTFHETGKDLGVETFGDITFDNEVKK